MKVIYGLLIVSLFFTACKSESSNSSENSEKSGEKFEKVMAVSISDGVPVRALPEKKGKYLTSLNLGETMSFLGETVADSADASKNFYKVELSDGSVAWARTYGIILKGEPAAIVTETPIYKRPDLVNKTEKNFYPLEFVVITNEKEDWVEITGANKKKMGWVKRQSLTKESVEVAVATLAQKTLLDKTGQIIVEKAPDFIKELPYPDSKLGAIVKIIVEEQIESELETEIEGAILEDEGVVEEDNVEE